MPDVALRHYRCIVSAFRWSHSFIMPKYNYLGMNVRVETTSASTFTSTWMWTKYTPKTLKNSVVTQEITQGISKSGAFYFRQHCNWLYLVTNRMCKRYTFPASRLQKTAYTVKKDSAACWLECCRWQINGACEINNCIIRLMDVNKHELTS
jgi:hypothetical protein